MSETHFTAMRDATRDDYQIIGRYSLEFFRGLPDRVLTHLKLLGGDTGGYAVDRLTHSLQSATRCQRDGRDDEYVVCALIHDIGDTLASANHADLAATILEPFVDEKNLWIVKHHGIFQGYYFFHHLGLDRDLRRRVTGLPRGLFETGFGRDSERRVEWRSGLSAKVPMPPGPAGLIRPVLPGAVPAP